MHGGRRSRDAGADRAAVAVVVPVAAHLAVGAVRREGQHQVSGG